MALMVTFSGVRGIVGQTLFPDVVQKYVAGFGLFLRKHGAAVGSTIIMGRDSRISGPWVSDIAAGILCSLGYNVRDIGIVPTPTVQWVVIQEKAAGGLIITSSHNPKPWNGLKFVFHDGIFLRPDQCTEMFGMADDFRSHYPKDWPAHGSRTIEENWGRKHVEGILKLPYLKLEEVRNKKYKVVLDAVNGAGGPTMTYMLEQLGCEVIQMNCEPNGLFAHTPEPIPENLGDLCAAVKLHHADVGLAVDPDTDRCVLIDERGVPIGEEYTLALAVDFMFRHGGKRGIVCKNLSTTRAIDDIVSQFGGKVICSPVGEVQVAKKMMEHGSEIGGEGNGGVMLKDCHLGRDAPVAACLALHCLALSGKSSMSALKASLPQWDIVKAKAPLESVNANQVLKHFTTKYTTAIPADTPRPVIVNTEDGVRIDTPDWWVHLRTSNTEPIIRVIGEARTAKEAERVCGAFVAEMKSLA